MRKIFFMGIALLLCFVMPVSAVSVVSDDGYYKISASNYNAWVNQSTGVIDYYTNADGSYTYVPLSSYNFIGKIITTETETRIDNTALTAVVTLVNPGETNVTITSESANGVVTETFDFYDTNLFIEVVSSEDYKHYNQFTSNFTSVLNDSESISPVATFETENPPIAGRTMLYNGTSSTTSPQVFMQWNLEASGGFDHYRSTQPNPYTHVDIGRSSPYVDHTKQLHLAIQTNEDRTNVPTNTMQVRTCWIVPNGSISKYGYNFGIDNEKFNEVDSNRLDARTWKTVVSDGWVCYEINPSISGEFVNKIYGFNSNPAHITPVWTQDSGLYNDREWHYFTNRKIINEGDGVYSFNLSDSIDTLDPITVASHIPYSLNDLADFESSISNSEYVDISIIGKSVQNRDIKLYHITNPNSPYPVKKKFLVGSGVHAAHESTGMYVMEGIVTSILNSQNALDIGDWYIIPCQNPDGVALGNSRYNANGVDLNREWNDPTQPETIAIDSSLNENSPFDGMFDLHNNGAEYYAFGWYDLENIEFSEFEEMLITLSDSDYTYYAGTGNLGTGRTAWYMNGYGSPSTLEFSPYVTHDGLPQTQNSIRMDGISIFNSIVPAFRIDNAYNTIMFKYLPKNKAIIGETVSIEVDGKPSLLTSDTFYASDVVNALFVPETDTVNVTISTWSNTQKVWTLSSETQQSVTHTIGGFPASATVDIFRDGVLYDRVTSNSAGAITWVYDGGFSEHEFSIFSGSDFTVSTTTGSAPYSVKFSNTSNATSYAWDFENDGIIDSTKQNPVHTYGKAGTYTVNLTVQNEYGNFSTVKTDYITVSAPAFASDPVAWFNWVFSYLSSMYVSIWVTA